MKIKVVMTFFILVFVFSHSANSASCNKNSPVTGFSTVNKPASEKAFFYKEPLACKTKQNCTGKKKAFLVTGNFVQVGNIEGDFACAIFRNYHGFAGKLTVGWILVSELTPIRRGLMREDLIGSWTKIPCNDNDDCIINIADEGKKTLSIELSSHFNHRPGESLPILSVKESKGQLLLTCQPGSDCNQPLTLTYDSKELEPGTIKLSGSETFDGIYRK